MMIALVALAAAFPLSTYLSITDVAWVSTNPQGSKIAYTSQQTGTWQVWVTDTDGTHRRQLTNGKDAADSAWWVPGSEHTIMYGSSPGGNGVDQFYYVRDDRPGPTVVFPREPKVSHAFGSFSPDGSKLAYSSDLRKPSVLDVYVLDRRTQTSRRVYTVEGQAYGDAWSSDGSKLLVRRVYTPYNEDLYVVDLRSGTARLLTPHTGDATFESGQFTKDGRSVVCITDLGREFHSIVKIDLATLRIQTMLAIPHDIDQVLLSPDGARMAYIVNDDGYGNVVVADATGETIGRPSMPPYIAETLVFAKGGRLLLYAASGPTFPKVLWSYDLQTRKTTRILTPNFHGVPQSSIVQPQIVHVRSFDGTMVPAWYFLPKHSSGKRKVLLDIHGGPEDQDRAWFYPFAQYFVSRGYALLDPNIRGSSGYGRAYLHAADGRKREVAIKDVGALQKWLVASGGADPRNVFIDGASYGGYVVLASLYHYPYAFAGGMDMYGVVDFVDFLQKTAPDRQANRAGVYGSLQNDRAFLASISPINHVAQIKRPVMIAAGANDTIVPLEQSEHMAAALRQNGVPVELHVMANEGHGVSNVRDLVHIYQWMLAFIQRYSVR